jgi:uncharacterized membrane protein YdfJ with MMPL/SSD domain
MSNLTPVAQRASARRSVSVLLVVLALLAVLAVAAPSFAMSFN